MKGVILSDNQMAGRDLSKILKALSHQDSLQALMYHKNELTKDCIGQIEHFLQEKNLEHLSIKSPLGTNHETMMSLFQSLKGCDL